MAFCVTAINAQTDQKIPFKDPSLSIGQRVDDLISRLTLEEKVAQLMNQTPAIERLEIPAYDWWNEALHGVARAGTATVFPQAIALAATFDEKAVFETFDIISDEARAKYHHFQQNGDYGRYKGLTFWTPNINILRDPRWGRGMETYGEDPYLTSRMGIAVVNGLQGNNSKYFKTHACAKHYAVHSGPEWNRSEFNVSVSPRDLRETYLPAFEALVKEGNVQEVMCAYNRFDGIPCCGSETLLHTILRDEWGFDGIVVTDCGAINNFWVKKRHETHPDAITASIDAMRSGTDLECGENYVTIIDAVKSGRMSEDELIEPLRRVLKGRFELGMFDDDKEVPWSKIPYSVVDSKKHKEKALEMARKSLVLLKNADNTLPLSKSIRKIAVVGPNANDSIMLWANYNGTPSSTITILQGIKNKLPNTEVVYDLGCDHTEDIVIEETPNTITFGGKPGFEAVYFKGINMEGDPIQKEITPTIDFDTRGNTQYAENVPLTNFSAIYRAEYKAPITGKITFSITGDDGYRLYINDKEVIEDWINTGQTNKSVEQDVKQGEVYQIRLEYYQKESSGQLNLTIGEKKEIDFSKTIETVKDADVIVFVGGISPTLEGEEKSLRKEGFMKGDRTNIELPEVQKLLMDELKKTGKPLVFVLCAGSTMALNWENENTNAIIHAWYGGQAAGTAVADVLFGDYNPSGRLPVTFYTSSDQLGGFEDYAMKGRTYRYLTQKPLYPFGYGLSYSTFKFKNISLSKKKIKLGESVNVNLSLENSSQVDGEEVVQVYIKNNDDKEGPIKSLRAFKRVNVPAGKTVNVSLELTPKSFESYYDDIEHLDVRPGNYTVYVGSSSSDSDLKAISFRIK